METLLGMGNRGVLYGSNPAHAALQDQIFHSTLFPSRRGSRVSCCVRATGYCDPRSTVPLPEDTLR